MIKMVDVGSLCWDEENVVTPRCLYGDDTWPRIVMASSGLYGTVNCQTYSAGDWMVMLGPRCFPRVIAHDYSLPDNESLPVMASLDTMKQKGSSYIIPLMLTSPGNQLCTLQILPLRRSDYVYKTAQDLLETFPRFVKVNRSFTIHPRQPMVIKGTILELLQTDLRMEAVGNGPSKFLICAWDDRRIPLKMETWGDFTVDDDACHYTLKEVVERFPLPQRIHFSVMPEGLTTNDIVLLDEATYDILISVPLLVFGSEDESRQDFEVTFFPVASGVEFVNCTASRDSEVYQKVIEQGKAMFTLSNFKDVNEVCKDVSVMELENYPYERVYENYLGSPPPVLPRKLRSKSAMISGKNNYQTRTILIFKNFTFQYSKSEMPEGTSGQV
jgi:hypothetical protein